MLFVAGTRDSLCDLALLRMVLGRFKSDWDLKVIEGGNHSFGLLKSANIAQQEIFGRILQTMADWLKAKFS